MWDHVTWNEDLNALIFTDLYKLEYDMDVPVKMEIEDDDVMDIFKELNMNVYIPVDDGADFICNFANDCIFKRAGLPHINPESSRGKSFGELFPTVTEYLYPIFKKAMETGHKQKFNICIYEDGFLKDFFESKVIYSNGKIYLINQDNTEKYNLRLNEQLAFESDVYPKCIIQDNAFVKVNSAYDKFSGKSEEEILKIPISHFDSSVITYNDTGLVLDFKDIVDLVLNGEYPSITYNVLTQTSTGEKKYLHSIARQINYDHRPAVQITTLKDLTKEDSEFGVYNTDILNILQKSSKYTFVFYNTRTNTYSWGKGLENILEGSLDTKADLKEIFHSLMDEDTYKRVEGIEKSMSLEKPRQEISFWITTLKGNRKYLESSMEIIEQNGEIVQFLNLLRDATKEKLEAEELERLNLSLKDAQNAASIISFHGDEQFYYWPPEIYKLIEREPREDDKYNTIIFNLVSNETRRELETLISELTPENPTIENKLFEFTTEGGKTKFAQLSLRVNFNEEGNVIGKHGYLLDVTDYILKDQDLMSYQKNLEDLLDTAALINFYAIDDEYYYSDEFYELIDREPRKTDKHIPVLYDLVSNELKESFRQKFSKLTPEHPDIENSVFNFTTESGKNRHIKMTLKMSVNEKGQKVQNGYITDLTDIYNQRRELTRIQESLYDAQEATNLAIFYVTPENEYHWNDEVYKILEREPRPTDKNRHIMMFLAPAEEQLKIINLIDQLEPNEYLGSQLITIQTENGKTKYLKFNCKKIYDKNGNFIQRNGYAQDITEDVLRNHELIKLNASFEDAQAATNLAINYCDANGEYHWSDEIYKIIEREPRVSDKQRHIIRELAPIDQQRRYDDLVDALEPNEFLGNQLYTIKTDNGKDKYLQINTKKVYDDNGIFIQRNGYILDVTDDILMNRRLKNLNISLKDAQKSTSLAVHYCDADGNYTWTDEIYNIIEREPRPDDVKHHVIMELMAPQYQLAVRNKIADLGPDESIGKMSFPITLESGKTKYIELDSRKIYDENGNLIQRNGYTRDITSYVKGEKERHLLSNIISDVLYHLKIGTFTIDNSGTSFYDEGFYTVAGISKEDEKNAFFSNVVDTANYLLKLNAFYASDDEEFEVTFEYKHPGYEELRLLTMYIVPYMDGDNKIFIGAIQDVTDLVTDANISH